MARLSVSLLGSPEVTLDGKLAAGWRYDKVRALLAYLIVEAERPHRRDSLAALLWPDWLDASARGNLRNALANLRTVIGDRNAAPPYLLIARDTIQFNAASDHQLDVATFRAAMDAQPFDARRLEEALALYRDPFLDGFSVEDSAAYEEWCLLLREQLEGQRLAALEQLVAHYEGQGEIERALDLSRRQVELAPWQESAHRQRMRLLALSGQRSAALVQYEACQRLLAQELGVEPSAETTQLCERIRDTEDLSGFSKLDRSVGNLPTQATPFVGRKKQLAEVRSLLARPEVRLLTLTGVGGTGKTRLALQVAAGLAEDYRDGVYWIPLAPLRDPALVVPTIAAALGVRESGEVPLLEACKYALRDKERLLAIDNFEQVIGAAPAVSELLSAAPGLKVLATSRAPLHVYGEHVYAVPPMEVPHPHEQPSLERLAQADAVSLFQQAAQRSRPGFALDEANARAVAEICSRLDGLPLAVELAAARVRLLSPETMLDHLSTHPGGRLQLLTGGPRDAPARQRTLRATIAWSYDLLDTDEQRLFCRLSVFAGGCTLEAAGAICLDLSPAAHSDVGPPSSLDLLESLVDQSLLQVSPSTTPRFTMLETVREYAWERLEVSGEAEAVRDRHAAYYAGSLLGWGEDLKGTRQLDALAEIEADLDNVRAAWDWAVDSDRERALDRTQIDWLDRAMEGLCTFYEWRGRYEEGVTACQRAVYRLAAPTLDAPSGASPASVGPASAGGELRRRVMACALAWQGRFGRLLRQYELADRSLERALALVDSPKLSGQEAQRAFVLLCMTERTATTDFHEAMRLGERSLALYRALGDRSGMAKVFLLLGSVAWWLGDQDKGRRSHEESLALYRELGDRRGIAWSLSRLSGSLGSTGQPEKGEQLAREAVAIARELGDVGLVRATLRALANVLHVGGRFEEAVAAKEQVLAMIRDQGILIEGREGLSVATNAHAGAGTSARHLGDYDKARSFLREALSLERESGHRIGVARCHLELGRLALAAGAYDEAEDKLQHSLVVLEKASWRVLAFEAYAALVYVARCKGERARARGYLRAALRPMVESGYLNAALQALPAMALLLADSGEVERAVELYALVSRHPYAANSRWFEDVAGKHIEALAATLPPEAVSAAQERGRARDLEATVRELLDELGGSPTD